VSLDLHIQKSCNSRRTLDVCIGASKLCACQGLYLSCYTSSSSALEITADEHRVNKFVQEVCVRNVPEMNGLPEPIAPIVPDLHASPAADMYHVQRSQPRSQGIVAATEQQAADGSRTAATNAPSKRAGTAAPTGNPQLGLRVPASSDLTGVTVVSMPSLEDVSSALSGIELAKQLPTDRTEIHKRFLSLLNRYPPTPEVMRQIDNVALEMHCPPPLIRPRTPDRREPAKHKLAAYSSHAPPAAARTISQHKQTVLDHPHSGTNIKRYLRMGKPPNPQFTYQAPSRPASRATSAGAGVHRSRSPPVSVRQVAGGDEANGDATTDENLTVQKRCGCCRQVCLAPSRNLSTLYRLSYQGSTR
jgi:hypothetical protein